MSKKKKKNKFIVNKAKENQTQENQGNKITIPIKGMHCRSCELLIEENLKEIPEIRKIQVSYKQKSAFIYSDYPLDQSKIKVAIEEAGYEIGFEEKKAWFTKDATTYKDIAIALVTLFIIYFLAKKLGLFAINVGSLSNPSSLFVILLIGLTAGFSTCMALVGGFILGISAKHAEKHPEATSIQKFRPHIFFNIGRISSYFILGGIIGMAGKAFQLSGTTLGFLIIIVGFVMLLVGLQLTELFPILSNFKLTLPTGISRFFGINAKHEKEYSHINSIVTGALTFFLPCGFTQAMQLYAMSTGSFIKGALILGTFALGTAPGLLGVGGLTSVLKGVFARHFFKFAGIVVTILAILNISNGFNLTGIKAKLASTGSISSSDSNNGSSDPNVKIENGIQTIYMDQVGSGYKPNTFTIKKGIPTIWKINSKSQSCAASIYSGKLGIRKNLNPGINEIKFTPAETGIIPFSCSMGMYTGQFKVIENDQLQSQNSTNDQKVTDKPSGNQSPSSSESNRQPASSGSESGSPIQQTPLPPTTDVQVIKTTYNSVTSEAISDLTPYEFTVTAGKRVRFEVAANADGTGCMSTIMIPGLIDEPQLLRKGKTLNFEFTPPKGSYDITCAMGVPRGKITAS